VNTGRRSALETECERGPLRANQHLAGGLAVELHWARMGHEGTSEAAQMHDDLQE
jgi:hypothetical protein